MSYHWLRRTLDNAVDSTFRSGLEPAPAAQDPPADHRLAACAVGGGLAGVVVGALLPMPTALTVGVLVGVAVSLLLFAVVKWLA